MASVFADVRYAVRLLVRSPGFALVTVLTLTLGIGANTAIFSTVDAVLLRPLPFGDPGGVVMVWEKKTAADYSRNNPAPANFADWKARNRAFSDMAATQGTGANLTDDSRPEFVLGRAVTPNFFSVLRVQPAIGRTFTEEEDRQAARVVVIGHELWRRRFGGDPSAVGRTLTMNGAAHTVIGVMPRGFVLRNREIEYWVPVHFTSPILARRTSHYLNVVARLRPGVSIGQASEDMRRVAAELEAEYPANLHLSAAVVPIGDEVVGNTRMQLLVLAAAAGAVLLIACANLASLLLSRALGRRGELGIRAALGASAPRLVRQLLAEAMLLSLTGGVAGLLVAPVGIRIMSRLVPIGLSPQLPSIVDVRLLGFALALSTITGLLFGIMPAAQAAKGSLTEILQHASPRSGDGRSRATRDVLVVLQVAAALVLLVAAGLMLRTLANLRSIDVGFRSDHLLTAQTTLPALKYRDAAARSAFYQRVVDTMRAAPGVADAAYGSTLPFLSLGNTIWYDVEGQTRAAGEPDDALLRAGTGRYLSTLGAGLVEGRMLDDRDGPDAPRVMVVNETLARVHWPNESALGHRIRINQSNSPWFTVVGVVRDVRERGYEASLKPGIYLSYAQAPDTWAVPEYIVVRTANEPLAMAASLRQAVAAVDPDQPISAVRSMEEILSLQVEGRRQQSTLLGSFAGLALLLASVGLYGVLAYAVSQRSREFGVRIALGATRADVMRLVLGRGIGLTILGLATGSLGAWAGTRAMQSMLYGVAPNDPATFAAVVGVLICVGLLACAVPALRATRVDPIVVLREN
jgi:putative ABC transport system permease protein